MGLRGLAWVNNFPKYPTEILNIGKTFISDKLSHLLVSQLSDLHESLKTIEKLFPWTKWIKEFNFIHWNKNKWKKRKRNEAFCKNIKKLGKNQYSKKHPGKFQYKLSSLQKRIQTDTSVLMESNKWKVKICIKLIFSPMCIFVAMKEFNYIFINQKLIMRRFHICLIYSSIDRN